MPVHCGLLMKTVPTRLYFCVGLLIRIHYYGKEDYAPINGSYQPFAQVEPLSTAFKALYNGNIAAMSVNITQFSKPLLYNYGYDQLNRLVSMRVYRNTPVGNLNTNVWNPIAINDYNEDIAYDASGNILKYKRYADNATLMDSLSYKYYNGTNKLNSIKDNVSPTAFTTDIDSQGNTNYDYDVIGNLTKDSAAGIGASGIEWTVYGKIAKITRTNGTVITYTYDAGGNRQSKKVAGAASGNGETWYVRDASGNVIGVYTVGDNTVNSGAMTLTELDLYGSSRLGMLRPRINMTATAPARTYMNGLGSVGYSSTFMRGRKLYELTNHLGNVLATISDKKIGVPSGSTISYYTADLISANDYYPFGMLQNNRSFTAGSTKYRYGFNGKENDNEIKGDGNQQDYGMRIYDPRTGRFLSVDPLTAKYPELTPYQFASNRPIDGIDLDGLEFANKIAENAYYHRSPGLNLPKPAPATIPVSTSSIQASYKDNAYVKSGQQAAFVPSRVPEEHMAAPDTYRERGLIGPKSIVKEDLGISKQNYYNAVGDNIAGGPIGAGTYMFYGEKASFYGAAGDQMAFSFGGVSGEGFLSKPISITTQTSVPQTETAVEAGIQLDWSRINYKGETASQHVSLHNMDNTLKPLHGVFNGSAETITNAAWKNKGNIQPIRQKNGNDLYIIPYLNAGYEGGGEGSRSTLNNVSIITIGGTNKLVTAFPSLRTSK